MISVISREDSEPELCVRPTAYESAALPPELHRHDLVLYQKKAKIWKSRVLRSQLRSEPRRMVPSAHGGYPIPRGRRKLQIAMLTMASTTISGRCVDATRYMRCIVAQEVGL